MAYQPENINKDCKVCIAVSDACPDHYDYKKAKGEMSSEHCRYGHKIMCELPWQECKGGNCAVHSMSVGKSHHQETCKNPDCDCGAWRGAFQVSPEKPAKVSDPSQPYKIALFLIAFAYLIWRTETIVKLLTCNQ